MFTTAPPASAPIKINIIVSISPPNNIIFR
jgi:hypothetical protein